MSISVTGESGSWKVDSSWPAQMSTVTVSFAAWNNNENKLFIWFFCNVTFLFRCNTKCLIYKHRHVLEWGQYSCFIPFATPPCKGLYSSTHACRYIQGQTGKEVFPITTVPKILIYRVSRVWSTDYSGKFQSRNSSAVALGLEASWIEKNIRRTGAIIKLQNIQAVGRTVESIQDFIYLSRKRKSDGDSLHWCNKKN